MSIASTIQARPGAAIPAPSASDFEPLLECDGDPGEEIAALAIDGARTGRRIAAEIENTQERIASAASNAQVAALEQKANNIRTSGIVDGCLGFAEAGFQADSAMSGFQAGGAGDSMAAMAKTQAGLDSATVETLQASGKLSDGFFSAAETGDDATAKADNDAADRATASARNAHEQASAQQEVIDKALDFYKTYAQTQASTGLTLAQRV